MNLNQLKLFYLAVKHGALGTAAKELNITQPAVTKGIQRLQDYYGVKLVQRKSKNLSPTPAGKALYKIADQIFKAEQLADECLLQFQQKSANRIRIHASESVGTYLLPDIINRFTCKHPEVGVTVDIVTNRQVLENTLNLQNVFGCVSEPVQNKQLIVRDIRDDELVIITPPGHPLSSKSVVDPLDLKGQVMIMHEKESMCHTLVRDIKEKNNLGISTALTLTNNEAIKRAVELGSGIALISSHAVREEVKSKRLVAIPLAGSDVNRTFQLIRHKDKYLPELAEELVDLILNQ